MIESERHAQALTTPLTSACIPAPPFLRTVNASPVARGVTLCCNLEMKVFDIRQVAIAFAMLQ
jgi:hypothetical protein